MRIKKIALNANEIPSIGTRNWQIPANARLVRHVYWIDETSPLQKDYIIRCYVIPINDVGNNSYSTVVVVAHFGGSVGSDRRQNQVKLSTQAHRVEEDTLSSARSKVRELSEERRSKGYRMLMDTSWTIQQNILASSVPIITRNPSTAPRSDVNGSPNVGINAPQAPQQPGRTQSVQQAIQDAEALRRRQGVPRPQPPPPPPETMETRMRRSYLLSSSPLTALVKDFPVMNEVDRGYLINDAENKILLGTQMSKAVMDDALFPLIMKYPKELLDLIPLNEPAEKKIRDFREEMEVFPKFRLIRRMD